MKTVEKPWGKEVWLEVNDKYVVKELHINPNQRISLQYHEKKLETMYVLQGHGDLLLDDVVIELYNGLSITIPPKAVHRLSACSGGIIILETSTPELEDVVRIEDDYNR